MMYECFRSKFSRILIGVVPTNHPCYDLSENDTQTQLNLHWTAQVYFYLLRRHFGGILNYNQVKRVDACTRVKLYAGHAK